MEVGKNLPQQEQKPVTASAHPEIHDRVLEAYLGKMGDQFKLDTQKRIHWVCSKVKGQRVLDVGCSQGIAAVLLGREGCQVTGIDVDPQAIAAAEAFLASQSAGVQKNVAFLNADFITYPFDREIYDTVILSEVLEHLVNPATFVELAAERLEAGGRLIITVPFGINDWIDHKRTYYATEPLRLVWKRFSVDDVELFGKWIGFSCSKRQTEIQDEMADWPWSLIDRVETAFYAIERSLHTTSVTLSKQLDDSNKKNRAANEQIANLKSQIDEIPQLKDALVLKESQLKASEEALAIIRAEVAGNRANLDEANLEYRAVIAQMALLKERIAQADAELTKSRQDIQAEQTQRHAGEVELAKLQEKLTHQQTQATDLRAVHDETQRKHQDVVAQMALLQERIAQAETELAKSRQEIQTEQAQRHAGEVELVKVQEKLNHQQTQETELRAALDETQLKNQDLIAQMALLQERIAQADAELVKSRQEIQTEQAQRHAGEVELAKLQEKLTHQETQTSDLRAALDVAQLKNQDLIAQMALLQERIEQADTELTKSRQDIQAEQTQRHAGEVELAKLQEQLKHQQAFLENQRNQVEQIVIDKDRQLKISDEELDKIREEVMEVRAKLDEADLNYHTVTEQAASLKELLAQYQSELVKTQESVRNEQAQRFDAEKELVKFQEQLRYQQSLTDELLQAKERKIVSLNERMERRRRDEETIREQLNEKNAALAGELAEISRQFSDAQPVQLQIAAVDPPEKLAQTQLENSSPAVDAEKLAERIIAPVINSIKLKQVASPVQAQIPRRASEFRVAFIADEFTYNSFKGEFQQIPLDPNTWKEIFEEQKPDLFFCESAWSGSDPVRRPWKGQIYASVNFKKENRLTLLEILQYCRKQGIPTVFWNKEDPTHYTDRVHDFVKTASEFDFVFTSAAECVDLYKRDYGLANVFALPFATNPRLFNPIETARRSSNIVFAGSWYANHQQRSQEMEEVLDALHRTGFNLEIYDRYHGDSDPLHKWPKKYEDFIKPGVPHHLMPQVYKSSRFGLNFNTVTDSSTMFARRVFELMSCNTLVVSNYSRGVEEMFGELVVFADRTPGRLKSLSKAEIDRLREQALHLVLKEHTYKQRWQQILTTVGLNFIKEDDGAVTVVCPVRKREDAQAAISYFERQSSLLPNSRLLLALTDDIRDIDVATYYQEFNRFGIGVTSLGFARRHALEGRYRPIETPYFAAIEAQSLPNETWLPKAVPHLEYMHDHLIGAATKKRYQLAPVAASQPLLGHAAAFSKWLDSGCQAPEKLVYCV